jgi:hypothetical protein
VYLRNRGISIALPVAIRFIPLCNIENMVIHFRLSLRACKARAAISLQ